MRAWWATDRDPFRDWPSAGLFAAGSNGRAEVAIDRPRPSTPRHGGALDRANLGQRRPDLGLVLRRLAALALAPPIAAIHPPQVRWPTAG